MNLLITNTHTSQAYSIIRALRSHAHKIVATMSGVTRFKARTSNAANSRYVHARYHVPVPSRDWLAGRVGTDNTEPEEAYIKRIEEICRLEDIDTIFPSSDAEVYLCSKNKDRLKAQGVLCVAPEYHQLRVPMDKYESVKAAEKAGLPAPRTFLPEDTQDIRHIADTIPPPWIIKPRFTAGSQGTSIVTQKDQLETLFTTTAEHHHKPMIQEFIPGNGRSSYYLIADQRSEIQSFMCPQAVRIAERLVRDSMAASIVQTNSPYRPQIQTLIREIGWWGGLTIQVKIDANDGIPKFMEMNPRLGCHLWFRTESGVNEPLMCLRVARGDDVQEKPVFPVGAITLEPIEDLLRLPFEVVDLCLYRLRTRRGIKPVDPSNAPVSLSGMARSFMSNYRFRRQKVFGPYIRHFFNDPLPSILWYYATVGHLLRGIKKRGR